MSKKAKIAVVGVVVLVLVGVGGWFVHSSMVKKDYDKAWAGYEKEVKAWADVNERYQVLVPVCGELAGEAECSELKSAGEEAAKTAENLSLDLKKVDKPSGEETQRLEKAASEIRVEREKFEPAVVKVEKAAEATIQDKFAPVLGEAEKKANEANGLVGSLKGKVKDENTLKALEGAVSELSSACGKWKGKDIPTGQEGVQAYLELKRLTLTCNDTVTKANESHAQWQKEEDERKAKEEAKIPVNVSAGSATLSGTVVSGDACDFLSNYYYVLQLDNPRTFQGQWPDGSTFIKTDRVQIAEGGLVDCGPFSPWSSYVGKRVTVSGPLIEDQGTGHYHAPVAFTNARLVQ